MTFGESKEDKNNVKDTADTEKKISCRKSKQESTGDTVRPAKAAKKTLSKCEKEKAAEQTLIACLQSKGAYLKNQTAIESMEDEEVDVDEKADELPDDFLCGFHASEEYACALAAYKNRLNHKNILLCDANEEDIPEYPAKSK